jgi:hypothetical protein
VKISLLAVPLCNGEPPAYNAENYVPRVTYRPAPLTRFARTKPVSKSRNLALARNAGLHREGEANKHATAGYFFGIGVLSAKPNMDINSSHFRLKRRCWGPAGESMH